MGYENPHAVGTEVLAGLGYNVTSHGDLGATYDSLINADLPSYTGKFYSPTEHEQISDVKYKKIEIGYDKGLRDMTQAFDGLPIEAYIPMVMMGDNEASASPTIKPKDIIIRNPHKDVIDEIIKAQSEAAGRELLMQDLEIEEIIIRRRIRKREISVREIKKSDN
ncbi:MAG: hypothetical protein ABIJ08_04560 [Nanoarchaeota archaeon]